jgi:CPA1 family monovalent cation:H+ antiporter
MTFSYILISIMEVYHAIAVITVLAALFGYINFRFIRLPDSIGVMVISLIMSLAVIGVGLVEPAVAERAKHFIHSIDFYTLVGKVLLSFLLFAGSIHIHAADLRRERNSVLLFSSIGTLLSTVIVATLLYGLTRLLGQPMGLVLCLLFGALISPTDPIAVLGILKRAGIAASLEVKITGESLFNDGVGIVIFLCVYQIAEAGLGGLSAGDVIYLFLRQAGGGLLLGILVGYAGFLLLRTIDYYQVEVMITIAMVMGGFMAAEALGVSGPLAMVVAGIITGNKSRLSGMSVVTREYIDKFWGLTDNLLNAVLFMLIGLEMLVIPFRYPLLTLGLLCIPLVLLARYISVSLPIGLLRYHTCFEKNAVGILTWGGLRGGLSIALALSIPVELGGDKLAVITYIVVLFSILVQGMTIGRVARKMGG